MLRRSAFSIRAAVVGFSTIIYRLFAGGLFCIATVGTFNYADVKFEIQIGGHGPSFFRNGL
jgi:hypothetical protein